MSNYLFFTIFACTIFAAGCSAKNNEAKQQQSQQPILGKITFEEGWVRPGSKGQTSAAYLSISNGTASADTIKSLSADAAKKAEMHESYKGENGISGMRPAPNQAIASGKDLYLQPGGLHLMLMNLKNDLAVGDSVTISFTFKHTGTKSIQLPVQMQQ